MRQGVVKQSDEWTHRQAIQIVAQLPDDSAAALAVLDRARELLICWNRRFEAEERPLKPVLVKG